MAFSGILSWRIKRYEANWLDYSAKQLGLSRTALINKAWKEYVTKRGITVADVPGLETNDVDNK